MEGGNVWIQRFVESGTEHTSLLAGSPIIEICDRCRVLIENHKGIVAYGCEQVQVKVCFGTVCICGTNLKLNRMSKDKLIVTGCISSVNLLGR